MKASKRGQVTIPKHIRDVARLVPGSEVNVSLEGSRIVITPASCVDRRPAMREAAAKVGQSFAPEFRQLAADEIMTFLRGHAGDGAGWRDR